MDQDELQLQLGYCFLDAGLLELALCHESVVNEAEGARSNERLEFLGDSVLGLIVCEYLYHHYAGEPEGRLAQMKSHLVSTSHLAERARVLELGRHLRVGRGEEGSRDRSTLLADTFEAVLGAIYLDGGLEEARTFVLRHLGEGLAEAGDTRKDFKSLLQEVTQRDYRTLPDYRVTYEEGQPHEKTFEVEVEVLGHTLGRGQGRSKREAGQQAAQQALETLEQGPVPQDLRAVREGH